MHVVYCLLSTVTVSDPKARTKRPRSNSSPGGVENNLRTMAPGGEKVGDLTPQQLKDIMSSLLDDKLAHLATKEDLACVSNQVAAQTKENQELKEQVGQLKKQEKAVLNKLLDLESRSRRNNVIIGGLTWTGSVPDYKQIVRQFCITQLGASDNIWINRAHPLGREGKILIAHIPTTIQTWNIF
ncbi:hypothetical protein J6590_083898 [Homalodisca vitripennis]|nr:hypothetical protein J6590_083898 [Homalodisca vitripennis]